MALATLVRHGAVQVPPPVVPEVETGEVVANILALNERFRIAPIDELVARKRAGTEHMALDARDLDEHGRLLDRLEAKLEAAHDGSSLPDEPTTAEALEDFVVRLRLDDRGPKAG